MLPRPGESHWPLVFFTVLTQAAAGTAAVGAALGVTTRAIPLASLALLVAGALAAVTHLGQPAAARFALANLRTSWLSREAALVAIFGATLIAAAIAPELVYLAAAAGLLLTAAISKLYMIRTVPAWNSWATPTAFFATAILLGAAAVATRGAIVGEAAGGQRMRWLGWIAAGAAGAEVLVAWIRRRAAPPTDGGLRMRQLLGLTLGAAILFAATHAGEATYFPVEVAVASVVLLLSELLGRQRFYASHRRVGL